MSFASPYPRHASRLPSMSCNASTDPQASMELGPCQSKPCNERDTSRTERLVETGVTHPCCAPCRRDNPAVLLAGYRLDPEGHRQNVDARAICADVSFRRRRDTVNVGTYAGRVSAALAGLRSAHPEASPRTWWASTCRRSKSP